MAAYRQSYSTTVAATPEECFGVLVDFERYPAWSSPITSCRVLTRGEDGLPKQVAFELDMTLKTVRYTLEYQFDPPHGGDWSLVEGDVAGVEGSYRFEPDGGGVKATCTQAIDVGFWVPGFLKRTFEQRALADSVEEFRRAVEARP